MIKKQTIVSLLLFMFILYPQYGALCGLLDIPLNYPNMVLKTILLLSVFMLIRYKEDLQNQKYISMFLLSFLIVSSTISIYYMFDMTYVSYLNRSYIIDNLIVNVSMILFALVIIGNLELVFKILQSNTKKLFYFYIGIVLLFFYVLFKFTSSVQFALIFGMIFEDEKLATSGFHLFFAYWFAIYSIVLLVLYRDKRIKFFLIGLVSLYILYLAGGRGTFLTFGFVFFLMQTKQIKITLVGLVFIIFTYFIGVIPKDELTYEQTRYVNLLNFEFTKDASYNDRLKQLDINFQSIDNNLFTGWFKSHIVLIEQGKYIHNFFSVLQDYGIVTFLLLLLFIFFAYISVLFQKNNIFGTILIKYLFLYSTVEIFLFKSVQQFDVLVVVFVSGYFLIINSKLILLKKQRVAVSAK
jgi:hypothetical protein